VGFAIENAITLLGRGLSDGLSEMTFTSAGWPQKQTVFAASDEGTGSDLPFAPIPTVLIMNNLRAFNAEEYSSSLASW